MRILRLLLLVIGVFALAGIVVCVARSDYRGFGSGVATTVLIWAGYFVLTYVSKREGSSPLGSGLACMACGKRTKGRDSLMASQSYAIQAGLAEKAADMEKTRVICVRAAGMFIVKRVLPGMPPVRKQGLPVLLAVALSVICPDVERDKLLFVDELRGAFIKCSEMEYTVSTI